MEVFKKEMIDVEVKLSKVKGDFAIIDRIIGRKELYKDCMEASLSYISYIKYCLYEVCGVEIPSEELYGDFTEEIDETSDFYTFVDDGKFDGKEFIFLTRGDDVKRLNELKSIFNSSDKDILDYLNYLEKNIKLALNNK